MDTLKWIQDGICLFLEPKEKKDFFADRDNVMAQSRAKAICHRCPVESICLEHALQTREPYIWGGTTEEERGFQRTRAFLGAWREESSRNSKRHDITRLPYASPSSPSHTSSQRSHSRLVLSLTAEYAPPSPIHAPSSGVLQSLVEQSSCHNQSSLSEPSQDSPKILQLQQLNFSGYEGLSLEVTRQLTPPNRGESLPDPSMKEQHTQSFSPGRNHKQLRVPDFPPSDVPPRSSSDNVKNSISTDIKFPSKSA